MTHKLLFSLLSSAIIISSCSRQPEIIQDSYHISYTTENRKLVKVDASIWLEDSLLVMSDEGPVPEKWADYVKNISVTDGNGKSVQTEKINNGGWKLQTSIHQQVKVSYEISLTHEESEWPGGIDGVAFVRDWGTFQTGRSLFVINGKSKKDTRVSFSLPETWKVSTPWKTDSTAANSYSVSDNTDLTESLLFAGTHQEFLLKREQFEVLFVLGGNGVADQKDQFFKHAESVLNYYVRMMGGLPVPAKGKKLEKIMVMINADSISDGEVIGNHINILLNPNGNPQDNLISWFIFVHEFFHLWNGKTLNVASTREDWFKEGVTNYYSIKALNQIGMLNDAATFQVMNFLFYNRYIHDSEIGKLSIRDAAEPLIKDKHWGLVYGGGLFTGISMDFLIRSQTSNTKSLDDLMRSFYTTYAGTDKYYTTEDVLKKINELSGTDQTGFFNKHVNGSEIIPIEKTLPSAGLKAEIKNENLLISRKPNPNDMEKRIFEGFLGKIE